MNENLAKFNYKGDKPSPIVKAQRDADLEAFNKARPILKLAKKTKTSKKGKK